MSISKKQVTLTLAKETKGAVQYKEIEPGSRKPIEMNNPDCVFGMIYMRKSSFEGAIPTDIVVTVEYSVR